MAGTSPARSLGVPLPLGRDVDAICLPLGYPHATKRIALLLSRRETAKSHGVTGGWATHFVA